VAKPESNPDAARRRYFPAVEGMRGVAAIAVVLGHSVLFSRALTVPNPEAVDHLKQIGFWVSKFGVTIFFGISGFLLYRPFVAARADGTTVGSMAPGYFWRRAVRILPAYWVALTLLSIWPGLPEVFTSHWWLYYGLLQVYSSHVLLFYGGLQTAWSLCVEVTFYLLLPLLALFLAERGVAAGRRGGIRWEIGLLGGLGILSVIAYSVLVSHPSTAYLDNTLLGTFTWFVWGMLLAAIQIGHPAAASKIARVLSRPWPTWAVGAAIFAAVALEAFPRLGLGAAVTAGLEWFSLGIAAGLLLAPAMLGDRGRVVRLVLANRVVVFLGTVSYGIYLYHFPLLAWFLGQGAVLRSSSVTVLTAAFTVVTSVVCGAGSWYLVERPLMRRARMVKALVGSRSGSPPPPASERPTALTAPSPDK
jgi:peptidoglycan/LPS O-acetylase OafA/YrhL